MYILMSDKKTHLKLRSYDILVYFIFKYNKFINHNVNILKTVVGIVNINYELNQIF